MSAAALIAEVLTTQAANLKAYYPCSTMTVPNDGQRDGDLKDISGNGKDLTSQFASTYNVAGLAGEAVTPDGTAGFFYRDDCVLGSAAPSEWTIFAVVKGGATSNRFPVSLNRGSSTNPFLCIATGNTTLSQAAVGTSTSADATFSIGVTDGTNQGCVWNGDQDNTTPTKCTGAHRNDVAIAHYTAGATATLVAEASVTLGTDTVDFDWTTADGTARETIVLAMGEQIPTAPSDAAFTSAGLVATITWTDNSDNETGFQVEYNLDGAGWSTDWPGAEDGSVAANGTSFVTPTLTAGTYQFRVRALGAAGNSDYSTTASGELTAGTAKIVLMPAWGFGF